MYTRKQNLLSASVSSTERPFMMRRVGHDPMLPRHEGDEWIQGRNQTSIQEEATLPYPLPLSPSPSILLFRRPLHLPSLSFISLFPLQASPLSFPLPLEVGKSS